MYYSIEPPDRAEGQRMLLLWTQIVQESLALTGPQAQVLALWSLGIVWAKRCGLSTVCLYLADRVGGKAETLRQRLREWTYGAEAKKGNHRHALAVEPCFPALLRWIVRLCADDTHQLACAIDATTVKQRFTVLSLSVLWRGCAIPIAWKIVRTTEKGAWKPYWIALFASVKECVPREWTVLVSSDRALYALEVYGAICAIGWHPFMRINSGGFYHTTAQNTWQPIASVVPMPGATWAGAVTCFKEKPLICTLVGGWTEGYRDPWLIVTDLDPTAATVAWYGTRNWIECGFKDLKSDGWCWHRSRMTDPDRAARVWLALAVATLWVVSVGSAAEAQASVVSGTPRALPPTQSARQTRKPGVPRHRTISLFLQGLVAVTGALSRHTFPFPGRLTAHPWPDTCTPPRTPHPIVESG